ncbi:hypothetical protein P7B02_13235 [Caulobacter segnis]|uniref:hypothetical protein n=1 Tax=Caulobacter segnis TaxID=88688 RepID=UPI00240F1DA7|nr:hypothetical protein [Caulobacter segnis]MDG2522509.1 hypothetical protein [Caulobacter segnis]
MAHQRLNIGEAVGEAVRFWSHSWRHAAGALGVAALALIVYSVSKSPVMGVAYGVYVVATLMAQGALFRVAFADRLGAPPTPRSPIMAGLQWTPMEGRLATTLILLVVLFAIVIAVGVILLAAITVGFASRGGMADYSSPEAIVQAMGPGGSAAMTFVIFIAAFLLAWMSIRLSLSLPATAAEGKVRLISTWDLTKGNAFRIFVAYLVVSAPVLLVTVIATLVAEGRPDPAASRIWLNAAGSAVAVVFYLPITVGLVSHIYRRLAPNPGAAA